MLLTVKPSSTTSGLRSASQALERGLVDVVLELGLRGLHMDDLVDALAADVERLRIGPR